MSVYIIRTLVFLSASVELEDSNFLLQWLAIGQDLWPFTSSEAKRSDVCGEEVKAKYICIDDYYFTARHSCWFIFTACSLYLHRVN
jgi:hypothetical protein